jgi:hypothetical protein
MGYFIQGGTYERVDCILCGSNYKTNETNKNGLSEEDVDYVNNTLEIGSCKTGDHLCLNCELEAMMSKEDLL